LWIESRRAEFRKRRRNSTSGRKHLAAATELREWFNRDPDKRKEFRRRYREELWSSKTEFDELMKEAGDKTATLLFGAEDRKHSRALVLEGTPEIYPLSR
jgi:uncharacterized protein YeaO (DUF488 family)